jgi:hypothetical protein
MKRLWYLIWTLGLLLGNQSAWAAAGDVSLDPANRTVDPYQIFTLDIRVDSGAVPVGAYDFDLTFDKNNLQVNTSVGDQGVQLGTDAAGTTSIVNLDNAAGTLKLTGFNVTGVPAGTNIDLLIVSFIAQGAGGGAPTSGNYQVGLTVNSLTNPTGQTIGTPNGIPATVTIRGVAVTHTLTVTTAGTGSGTVTSSPAGINCGNDCTEDYPENTQVTLTATPDNSSSFDAWSGDADCSDGSVTMSADVSCVATFISTAPPPPTSVPSLSPLGLLLLSGMLGLVGAFYRRKQ